MNACMYVALEEGMSLSHIHTHILFSCVASLLAVCVLHVFLGMLLFVIKTVIHLAMARGVTPKLFLT